MSEGDGQGLRIVVADDSKLLREGVVNVLTSRGFEVVAEAVDGDELLRKVSGYKPDVAVVDIRMPPSGTDEGLRAADRIGEEYPGVAVLVLSEYLEPKFATRLLDAETPGRGYLLKQTVTDLDAFANAIRRVAAGESVIDQAIVNRLLERRRAPAPMDELSEREREILGLIAEGRSNHGIAEELVLSERTVEVHIRNIFQKLELTDTPDDHRRVLAVLTHLRS